MTQLAYFNAWLQRCVLLIILAYFLVWAVGLGSVHAGTGYNPTKCADHYLGGASPVFTHKTATARSVELCSIGFAVLHSAVAKEPLYSAEHVTKETMAAAAKIARDDAFHADSRLPKGERAELADYKGTAFDRGHMSPAGDQPSADAMHESFALSNMVPQDQGNNRGPWRLLEERTREQARREGEVWVVSGPLFVGDTLQAIGASKVLVPSKLYKAVYLPSKAQAWVYVVDNKTAPDLHIYTVDQFATQYGIEPFPALPDGVRHNQTFPPSPLTH